MLSMRDDGDGSDESLIGKRVKLTNGRNKGKIGVVIGAGDGVFLIKLDIAEVRFAAPTSV